MDTALNTENVEKRSRETSDDDNTNPPRKRVKCEYVDPVTLESPQDPVILVSCGHTVERSSLNGIRKYSPGEERIDNTELQVDHLGRIQNLDSRYLSGEYAIEGENPRLPFLGHTVIAPNIPVYRCPQCRCHSLRYVSNFALRDALSLDCSVAPGAFRDTVANTLDEQILDMLVSNRDTRMRRLVECTEFIKSVILKQLESTGPFGMLPILDDEKEEHERTHIYMYIPTDVLAEKNIIKSAGEFIAWFTHNNSAYVGCLAHIGMHIEVNLVHNDPTLSSDLPQPIELIRLHQYNMLGEIWDKLSMLITCDWKLPTPKAIANGETQNIDVLSVSK